MSDSGFDQLQREGEALERVLVCTLRSGVARPTTSQILDAVRGDKILDQPHHGRLASRQRIVTRVRVYLDVLAPDPDRWTLTAFHPVIEGRRGDLLFTDALGYLLLDELKSGASIGLAEERAQGQAEELLAAGRHAHGDRFLGVRVVFLAAPRRSYILSAAGRGDLSDEIA